MSASTEAETNWQEPTRQGLSSLSAQTMPSFELLLLDSVAAYVMGAGPLERPYTVEHGTRVVSALFEAMINSQLYRPERSPESTDGIDAARASVVAGAQAFSELGDPGLNQLVGRLVPAVLGELETHRDAPEDQVYALFFYAMLAVASGPMNLLDDVSAAGVREVFAAWDDLLGQGFVPPWRLAKTE